MGKVAQALSERRKHSRLPIVALIAEIRGQRFDVLDISFGGLKVNGRFAVAGGLITIAILPKVGRALMEAEKVEVPGRVERVEGDLTAVRFSYVTDALSKLILRNADGDQTS